MKIDFNQTLHHINGAALSFETNADGSIKVPATLGNVSTTAVMAPRMVNGEPQPASGEEALRALSLSLRIYEATGPIDVTAEEVVYLKERIAGHWTLPIVVGQAWRMLEDIRCN